MLMQIFLGCVVRLPINYALVDIGFQKHESLVLLLKQNHDELGMLAVASIDKLPMSSIDGRREIAEVCSCKVTYQTYGFGRSLAGSHSLTVDIFSCLQELLSNPLAIIEMEDIKGLQKRKHPHPGLQPPMAVSIENIATVFSSNRVVHYDLEAYE